MKKTKEKRLLTIVASTFICFSLFGCSSEQSIEPVPEEERVYLTEEEISYAYANPEEYKGKYVKLYGIVFGEPEISEDSVIFQMYADAENYEKNTVVGFAGNIDISENDYVFVDGMITGTYEYKNMLGGTIVALEVVTNSVEKSNYIDCCSPTIKKVELNKTIEQKGYSVTLEKVEFSKTETRLYFSVSNNGSANFYLSDYDIKVVQNEKQYECQYNYNAEYPKLQTDLISGTSTSGIVSFPVLDSESGMKIYCEGYCDDWNIELNEYIFEF